MKVLPVNRVLFEVYETDEENYEPYEPVMSSNDDEEATDSEESTEEEEEEEDLTTDDESKFTLHMGEILTKFFYTDIIQYDHSEDYADISNTGSISLPYSKTNLDECYLGVRCRVSDEQVTDTKDWDIKAMPESFLGFITDETFTSETTKLSLSGMTKCLEKKYQFEFSQTPISKIMEEVIKTAGLEPVIDFTGLNDEVIDFSTASSSGDSDSDDDSDVSGIAITTDIKALAKKICKGKKDKVAKAKAIWTWMHDNLEYEYYRNSHKTPKGVLSSGRGNCVDHAKLYYVLGSAVGLKVGYINTSCLGGHVYNGIDINGKIYTADTSVKSVPAFDTPKSSCPRVTSSNISYNWSNWGSYD